MTSQTPGSRSIALSYENMKNRRQGRSSMAWVRCLLFVRSRVPLLSETHNFSLSHGRVVFINSPFTFSGGEWQPARLSETARLAFFFASPRHFDILDCENGLTAAYPATRSKFHVAGYAVLNGRATRYVVRGTRCAMIIKTAYCAFLVL